MGLFSALKKLLPQQSNEFTSVINETCHEEKAHYDTSSIIDRRTISDNIIDSAQTEEASKLYREAIYEQFYSNYPELPFISKDRELYSNWPEQVLYFPEQSIIPKRIMTRYKDGLLPGHVYMLYWISKNARTKIPSYFEYDYGICFQKELIFLKENGYLNNRYQVTPKGEDAIKKHYRVINNRHPKPESSGNISSGKIEINNCGRSPFIQVPNGRFEIPFSDRNIIFNEIDEINRITSIALGLADLNVNLTINKNEFLFRDSNAFYEYKNLTPSGKEAKYPLTMHYACVGHNIIDSSRNYFGRVKYARNGTIAAGQFIFWQYNRGYMIYLSSNKNAVYVSRVDVSNAGKRICKYKNVR